MKAKELSAAGECAAATEHACASSAEVLSGSADKTSDGVLPSEVCNLIEDAGGGAIGDFIVVSDESPEPEAPAPTDRPTAVIQAAAEGPGALDPSDLVSCTASSVADCAADKDVQIVANFSETTEHPDPHSGAAADLPEVHLPEVHLSEVQLVIPLPASAAPAEAADLPKGKRNRRSRSKAEEEVAVVPDPKAPGTGIDGQAVEVPTGGLQQQEGGSRRPRRCSKGGKAAPQPASGSTTPIPAGTAAPLGETTQVPKEDSAGIVKASVVDLTSPAPAPASTPTPAPALASTPAPGSASVAAPGEHVDLSGVSPLAGPPVAADLPARLPQGKGAMFFMPAAEKKRLLEEV